MTKLPSELKQDTILDASVFSFQYDQTKISIDVENDEPFEIETIEIPVVKKMVFQFKKPVRLEFS